MTDDTTSELRQSGFIDSLIEHYQARQDKYRNSDPETQELDYDSFITEWSSKLDKLVAAQRQRWEASLIEHQHLYNVKSTDGILNKPNTGVLAIPVTALDAALGGQRG